MDLAEKVTRWISSVNRLFFNLFGGSLDALQVAPLHIGHQRGVVDGFTPRHVVACAHSTSLRGGRGLSALHRCVCPSKVKYAVMTVLFYLFFAKSPIPLPKAPILGVETRTCLALFEIFFFSRWNLLLLFWLSTFLVISNINS